MAWNVPIFSASTILREASVGDVDSGKLLDDETVASTIWNHLAERRMQHVLQDTTATTTATILSHYVMDGFPRTRNQIDIMEATWPEQYRVCAAFHIDVPDTVCVQKIAGRRRCRICNQEPNSADVQTDDGFDLPPTRPQVCKNDRCDPAADWSRRPDDESADIVRNRIAQYRVHEEPLIDYYRSIDGLCSLTPYRGEKDIPTLQKKLEEWMMQRRRQQEIA
jgi:adenylate kinase family enzyme